MNVVNGFLKTFVTVIFIYFLIMIRLITGSDFSVGYSCVWELWFFLIIIIKYKMTELIHDMSVDNNNKTVVRAFEDLCLYWYV